MKRKIKKFKGFLNEALAGDELSKHIYATYVGPELEADDEDNYSDEFEYYDNIIYHAVGKYIEAEEPEREYDDEYIDELQEDLKEWWQPI